jgi:hypothetical protein
LGAEAAAREQQKQKQRQLEQENEVRLRMQDLRKQLAYIDKTNWFFERDTVDFGQFIPFDQEQANKHSFTLGQAPAGPLKK